MKAIYTVLPLFLAVLLVGCKVSQADMQQLQTKIDTERYTFVARSALPQRGKNINLTSEYTLYISPDTISAHLPYFGRAYSAPLPGEEGIKFTSTQFRKQVDAKKEGYEIHITTQDTRREYTLYLKIGAGGYANLYVKEHSRDAISFYGVIE